ncbi:hypothetical protein ACWCO0_09635 [Streptomyces tubercidicus]
MKVPETPAEYRAMRAKSKPEGASVALVAVWLALALGLFALNGWLLMIVVGGIHAAVPAIPAIGYGTALLVLLAARLLRGPRRTGGKA